MGATPYVGVIVLAVLAKVAAFGYVVIAILAVLRARGDQSASREEPASA